MPLKVSNKKNQTVFEFSGNLTKFEVTELHKKLSGKSEKIKNNNAIISLAQITECDIAGLQLVISLVKTLRHKNINIDRIDVSENVKNIMLQNGMELGI